MERQKRAEEISLPALALSLSLSLSARPAPPATAGFDDPRRSDPAEIGCFPRTQTERPPNQQTSPDISYHRQPPPLMAMPKMPNRCLSHVCSCMSPPVSSSCRSNVRISESSSQPPCFHVPVRLRALGACHCPKERQPSDHQMQHLDLPSWDLLGPAGTGCEPVTL